MPKWILNASPLILLGKTHLLSTISPLAEQWLILAGVITEVERKRPIEPYLNELKTQAQVMRQTITSLHPVIAAWDLGQGESEVLTLALMNPGAGVVLDDLQARKCALLFGVTVTGSLGLLLSAKRRGLIAQVRPAMASLQRAGLFLDPAILHRILTEIGEAPEHESSQPPGIDSLNRRR